MDEHNKVVMTAELDLIMIMITVQFRIRVCTVHTEPRPHPQSTMHVGVVYEQDKDSCNVCV